MPATNFGLDDVLNQAFQGWQPSFTKHGVLPSNRVFGAVGRGGAGDSTMIGIVRSRPGGGGPSIEFEGSPMNRMFGTSIGDRAVTAIGNETRTLAALERLSLEIMARALYAVGKVHPADRLLVVPARDGRPPVLMLMSPDMQDAHQSRMISDELDLPFPVMEMAMRDLTRPDQGTQEAVAFLELQNTGPLGVAELFLISQPEIILTRRPRMIPLCAPSPYLTVEAAGQLSTAGVFCHDDEGEFGVTACYHGTGDKGTSVRIGAHIGEVKHANPVQDIVFIPLDTDYPMPPLTGRGGLRNDREPAKADYMHFDGATNQNRTTRIFGTDNGLLRARPTVQLKVQTDPDTDCGDSGCALIDDQDRVIGFAFERTDYNDYPQFTDWIWAANALRSLNLTVI